MKYKFTFFCTLISTLLIYSIPQCRKNNVNEGNEIVDHYNIKTKNKHLYKNGKEEHIESKEHEEHENNVENVNSHNTVEKNIDHHNNDNINENHDINNNSNNNNNDVKNVSEKDNDILTKEIINEIHSIKNFNKKKNSVEELKLLEEKSQNLLVDINEWVKSVREIEDKSNDLKDMKNQILINIKSLSEILTAEIENIKYIKNLQKKQNELFLDNWVSILPSISDNLIDANEFSNYDSLDLLKTFNKKNNEKNVIDVNEDNNTKSHSLHIFLNYFICFLIITVIFN